ncbi:transmembrane protein 68-like protein [Leptotrombidium deliense]|uniref:Transmembrane protein 68-like protein n=1 Tax=Leptotrombidium deliense TaxID=299467 RepID=A0A443SR85_9ACAR|nr:transmembrane protein 68-like protein [Leptotrombidium deliense]
MNIHRLGEHISNYTYYSLKVNGVEDYVDIDFVKWLIWLFTPIIVTFILPFLILVLFYVSALIVHIYKHRSKLQIVKEACVKGDYFDGARMLIAYIWDAHGCIWHGYEIVNLNNIPQEGPALIVYYHGAIPLDYYYLLAKCLLNKRRLIKAVGDRFLFSIPGKVIRWKLMMEVFHVFPGTVQTCVQVLEKGDLLSIAPGGVKEAQFGDNTYNLIWGNRIGFAKVALAAKVPIIPVFTVNIREAFRSLSIGKNFFRKIYEKTRLPIVPIYGGFPVKLKTIVGKPIEYDKNLTPEQLALKVAETIETMIRENQRIPGSILKALFDRFKWSTSKQL